MSDWFAVPPAIQRDGTIVAVTPDGWVLRLVPCVRNGRPAWDVVLVPR